MIDQADGVEGAADRIRQGRYRHATAEGLGLDPLDKGKKVHLPVFLMV